MVAVRSRISRRSSVSDFSRSSHWPSRSSARTFSASYSSWASGLTAPRLCPPPLQPFQARRRGSRIVDRQRLLELAPRRAGAMPRSLPGGVRARHPLLAAGQRDLDLGHAPRPPRAPAPGLGLGRRTRLQLGGQLRRPLLDRGDARPRRRAQAPADACTPRTLLERRCPPAPSRRASAASRIARRQASAAAVSAAAPAARHRPWRSVALCAAPRSGQPAAPPRRPAARRRRPPGPHGARRQPRALGPPPGHDVLEADTAASRSARRRSSISRSCCGHVGGRISAGQLVGQPVAEAGGLPGLRLGARPGRLGGCELGTRAGLGGGCGRRVGRSCAGPGVGLVGGALVGDERGGQPVALGPGGHPSPPRPRRPRATALRARHRSRRRPA